VLAANLDTAGLPSDTTAPTEAPVPSLDLSQARILRLGLQPPGVPVPPQRCVLWLEHGSATAAWAEMSPGLVVWRAARLEVRIIRGSHLTCALAVDESVAHQARLAAAA
jgi:hypothetical protein